MQVEEGTISGVATPDSALFVFKGVPFAAPPVGELRWRAPQPAKHWTGVRRADTFGYSAIQADTGAFGPWTKEFIFGNKTSEDCLYLNIWTAAKRANAKLPVLVYIHGGGFSGGSGEVAVYDGTKLAIKGLVVVTINYRLGALGFFAHPELTKESGHNSSGNYGLLDQVAALRWIQKNIAAFGGNPNNVTIAGQSAGAASVHYLTASPLAKGLFHRAIAQSGSGVGRGFTRPREVAEQEGIRYAQEKKVTSLSALRALPAKSFIGYFSDPFRFGPAIDGWFLTDDVTKIFAEHKQNDVPTLTGLTADEGSAFPNKMSAEAFRKQAQQRYGEHAEAFLSLYPANSDAEVATSQRVAERDQGVYSMALWAEQRANTAKTKSYLYYFAHAIPWPQHPEFGAFHTSEVPYVFHNLHLLDRPWTSTDQRLADIVSSYWVNFATKGDPNGKGLPVWQAFTPQTPLFLRMDANTVPMPLPAKAKREVFKEMLIGRDGKSAL